MTWKEREKEGEREGEKLGKRESECTDLYVSILGNNLIYMDPFKKNKHLINKYFVNSFFIHSASA